MSFGFYLAEILTTFVEGVLLFLTVELFCGKKHSGKANIGWVILLSVVYTVVLLVLNEVDRLSILTLFVAILSGACLSVFIVPKKFAYRLLITSHYALVIVIVDSVVSTLVGGILSNPELPFHFIFSEGIGRTIYICGIKVSEVGSNVLPKYSCFQFVAFSRCIFERQLHFQCGFVYVSSENADFTSSSMGFHVGVSHIDSISIFFQGEAKRKGTGE